MPDTPIYGITYPCEGAPIAVSDFYTFATDVEVAIGVVDAEATLVTHLPNARAAGQVSPALGVEGTYLFTIPTSIASSGITVAAGAGTMTIITPGIYLASVRQAVSESTLTITSSRVAVTVNGVNQVIKKFRGSNPAGILSLSGSYTVALPLAAGDVVTFRYLWTGTGALANPASATVALDLLATP
jgi:hypothetical protein